MHPSNRISQSFSNRPQSTNIITIESMIDNIATKFKSKQPLDKIIEAITKHLQTIENNHAEHLNKDIYKEHLIYVEKIKTEDKLQYLECIFSICDQPQLFKANTVQNNELLEFIKITITQINENYFDNTEKVIQEANNSKAIKDSNLNTTATASNINSNTSVKNTKPTKKSELKTNSPKNEVFYATQKEINNLRKYMATIILHQWNKPDIQNSLMNTISDYHYDYFDKITSDDCIWDSAFRKFSQQSQYLKNILKQIFPNITTKHEYIAQFGKIMTNTNNMNKQPSNGVVFNQEVVKKLINLFVIPNASFVHKTWLELLCKTNELDINQIMFENGHFYIRDRNPEFIPSDGNCAFHCIDYLFKQQNLS